MKAIRFTVTYDEAAALKRAGFPQEMQDGDACYAHMDLGSSRMDRDIRKTHPEWENPSLFRWKDGRVQDLVPAAFDAAAPRLEQVLARLWSEGIEAEWLSFYDGSKFIVQLYDTKYPKAPPFLGGIGDDRLAALVSATVSFLCGTHQVGTGASA